MSQLKMPGASGGPKSPFIYLRNMLLKNAETVPSPDKEVFTADRNLGLLGYETAVYW
jgi:hypothetical protein